MCVHVAGTVCLCVLGCVCCGGVCVHVVVYLCGGVSVRVLGGLCVCWGICVCGGVSGTRPPGDHPTETPRSPKAEPISSETMKVEGGW